MRVDLGEGGIPLCDFRELKFLIAHVFSRVVFAVHVWIDASATATDWRDASAASLQVLAVTLFYQRI
jgi:hypothetical protein